MTADTMTPGTTTAAMPSGAAPAAPEAADAILPIGADALTPDALGPEAVGFKAYTLIQMARAGLPVPPGFVIGTGLCRRFLEGDGKLPDGLAEQVADHIRRLESATGTVFGGARRPLLVSVRSGAAVSMPGMMETLLNVGLNETTLRGLIRATGNPRLAWDCWRRLIQQYAEVVLGARPDRFRRAIAEQVAAEALDGPAELDTDALQALARTLLSELRALTGHDLPRDPMAQLLAAIAAVMRSWTSDRAAVWRRLNRIDDRAGTAVTVQAMVYGNAGGTSGSGVGFTRDPATGEDRLYLDFLFNAQGEDVVSGRYAAVDAERLGRVLPAVRAELGRVKDVLERRFGDMQDFEFTVQDGRLYLLQTRAGKRTPWAALRIAVDLVRQGIIESAAALDRLSGLDLDAIERVRLDAPPGAQPVARAIPAGLGVAVGAAAFDAERARRLAEAGTPVILVRPDMAADDIAGLAAAEGVLTATGARTSHAAVVARQLGKVCLVGCAGLSVDPAARRATLSGRPLAEGEYLSLDGDTGEIFPGRLPVRREKPSDALAEIARWRRERAGE